MMHIEESRYEQKTGTSRHLQTKSNLMGWVDLALF